jgi:hypothetical protein
MLPAEGMSNRAMIALVQRLRTDVQRAPPVASPTSGAAGQVNPTVASGPVTVRGLLAAYDGVRADFLSLISASKGDPWTGPVVARSALLTRWVRRLNEAFTLMAIDTIDARATYLAHAYVESFQFRRMTESETGRYTEDPKNANLNKTSLEAQYPKGSDRRARVDPGGGGDWTYIGRGPLQVTNQAEYAATLTFLEQQADARDAAGDSAASATMRSAVAAIRADPREAANPEYAFLFSAANMKRLGGDVRAGTVAPTAKTFEGHGGESSWETGSHTDPQAATKKKGYEQALTMLNAGEAAGADLPAEIQTVLTAHEASAAAPGESPSTPPESGPAPAPEPAPATQSE